MGPELELNVKSEDCALEKENVAVPVPAFSESKEEKVVLQPCTKYKGIEQAPMHGNEEDVQVNIIGSGCLISGGKVVEDACEEVTDTECSSSSSFGDTGSGVETTSGSAFSDTEVESESPMCDGWGEPIRVRKKKVTDHWTRFIRPLSWRCKWIELQLIKLNSQALKYAKELEAYDYKKQLDFSKFAVDDFGVKSVPISDGIRRNKVMTRKKRKRAEQCDLSSYVSNHRIFSYYEKKTSSRNAYLEDSHVDAMRVNTDIVGDIKFNDTWSSVVHEDNDKSFNDIIQKIDELLSQVENLRNRIDNVISENPGKFCSVTRLSRIGSFDRFNHPGLSSTSLAVNENTFPVGVVHASSQHNSELNMEDLLLTENSLSTREGITPFIGTNNGPQLDVSREKTKDEILNQCQVVKRELHDIVDVSNQLVEKTKESVEEQKPNVPAQVSECDLVSENAVSNSKAGSTSRSNFRRKARRGRKKSGPKSWSRR